MIETRLLRYFLTVAQEKSITAAAKALHITQPTLSRQMAMLEEEVGTPLFVRGSRPLELTGKGMLLRRRAEEILELIDHTGQELRCREENLSGRVSLGCGEMASMALLAKRMAAFQRRHPYVTFDVFTGTADQIKRRIDNGLADAGLLLEPAELEHYEYIRMPVRERWVALLPADTPLAGRAAVTAEELARLPVILPSRPKIHNEVANWFGAHYPKLRVAGASSLSANSALMVQAGMGFALTLEGAIPFLEPRGLRAVPLTPELTATSVLAWKRGQPLALAAERFLQDAKCFLGMGGE